MAAAWDGQATRPRRDGRGQSWRTSIVPGYTGTRVSLNSEEPSLPTELVEGKYRVTRLIGQGGMGSVWEGTHVTLGTRVAVKFIDAAYANSPEARSRFENEARAAARLNSKHVVKVFDHGVMPDGRPFIVMEFLQGEPLDGRLDRLGRIPPEDTARLITQVCRALARAHEAGIVHRDLKPENIFLVWDEEDSADIAKVVDFGIAKFTDGSKMGVSSATRTGSVLGTPYYMSPEQARGLRSVDYRSDLWSLGVITFRCIVGRLPFEGEAIGDLLVKICTSPIPVPSQFAPDVPVGFDAWFERALQREPGERFSSAAELAESLRSVCGGARPAMGSAGYEGLSAATVATAPPQTTPGIGARGMTTPMPVVAYSDPSISQAGVTGAPLTHTPVLQVGGGRRKTWTLVGALGGLVVLVLGVVMVRVLSSDPQTEQSPASSAQPEAASVPTGSGPANPPPVVSAGPVIAPVVAPLVSVATTASTASPEPPEPPPTVRGRPRPRPVAEPPAPQPPPQPRPRPQGQQTGKPIDLGY